MNNFIVCIFCLLIGFFLGVGSNYTASSLVISLQARKIVGLTETYYSEKKVCQDNLANMERKLYEKIQRDKKSK